MKPKYKVGDQVLIKSKYDPGKSSDDYIFGFTKNMLEKYGGTMQTISNIRYNYYTYCFMYEFVDIFEYAWSEEMFNPLTDEL